MGRFWDKSWRFFEVFRMRIVHEMIVLCIVSFHIIIVNIFQYCLIFQILKVDFEDFNLLLLNVSIWFDVIIMRISLSTTKKMKKIFFFFLSILIVHILFIIISFMIILKIKSCFIYLFIIHRHCHLSFNFNLIIKKIYNIF